MPINKDFSRRASGLLVPENRAKLLMAGSYHCELTRTDGSVEEWDTKNPVVNQGLNYILGAGLAGGSQITAWYLALFTGNYTVLASDTASVIASNASELAATYYTAGARQVWTPNSSTVTGQSTSNSSAAASFTFQNISSPPTNIYGAFLVSSATAVGTGGSLFSGAQFASLKGVANGDVLQITYTYTAASA